MNEPIWIQQFQTYDRWQDLQRIADGYLSQFRFANTYYRGKDIDRFLNMEYGSIPDAYITIKLETLALLLDKEYAAIEDAAREIVYRRLNAATATFLKRERLFAQAKQQIYNSLAPQAPTGEISPLLEAGDSPRSSKERKSVTGDQPPFRIVEQIQALPSRQAEALVTWCHTGSYAETGRLLGISGQAATKLVGKAVAKLRGLSPDYATDS